jgi:hypothetical protein
MSGPADIIIILVLVLLNGIAVMAGCAMVPAQKARPRSGLSKEMHRHRLYKRANATFVPVGRMCPDCGQVQKMYPHRRHVQGIRKEFFRRNGTGALSLNRGRGTNQAAITG